MNLPATKEPVAAPEFQVVGPEHARALACFFERLRAQDVEKFFHTHPLTAEEAQKRAAYRGLDFYCVLVLGDAVVGYGMLRGWDEGYEVPSIGVVVDPSVRGRGYSRSLLRFLRATARQRGVNRLRATVDPDNIKMVAHCRMLGYVFESLENGKLVGFRPLDPPAGLSPEEIARWKRIAY